MFVPVMLALASMTGTAFAQNITVSPKRVVVEHGEKYGEMLVVNSGDEEAVVRVSLRNLRMTSAGNMVVVDDTQSDLHVADQMVRVAPRQLKLAPKSSQVVRIAANRQGGLESGEYRTHLAMKVIPSLEKLRGKKTPEAEAQQSAIRLFAVTEQVFPIIIRQGSDLDAKAEIRNAKLIHHDGGFVELAVQLARGGKRSIFGDIRVTYTDDTNAQAVEVGAARALAVYREIDTRLARIPLDMAQLKSAGYGNGGGHFRITFTETRGKGQRTEASYVVPVRPDA